MTCSARRARARSTGGAAARAYALDPGAVEGDEGLQRAAAACGRSPRRTRAGAAAISQGGEISVVTAETATATG